MPGFELSRLQWTKYRPVLDVPPLYLCRCPMLQVRTKASFLHHRTVRHESNASAILVASHDGNKAQKR